MREQTGPAVFDEEGICKGDGSSPSCSPLACEGFSKDYPVVFPGEYAPKGTYISLMSQLYSLRRGGQLSGDQSAAPAAEYEEVVSFLMETGIEEGWLQDLDSAKSELFQILIFCKGSFFARKVLTESGFSIIIILVICEWGYSAVSAPDWQSGGRGFKSLYLHQSQKPA